MSSRNGEVVCHVFVDLGLSVCLEVLTLLLLCVPALRSLDDRMDSYFLSETAKYLFLLFDASLLPHGHTVYYPSPTNLTRSEFQSVAAHIPRAYRRPLNDTVACGVEGSVATECGPGEAERSLQLALEVRNGRSVVPALPFNPLQVIVTCVCVHCVVLVC